MKMGTSGLFLTLLVIFLEGGSSFYLPGVKMITYKKGDSVPLYVNSLTSSKTLLPIDYYKLPMCQPDKVEYQSENLGEYLTANRIQNSAYKINFLKNEKCKVLCQKDYTPDNLKQLDSSIKDGYRVNWILDNLPAATPLSDGSHSLGFSLGSFKSELDKRSQMYNHASIRIGYHIPIDKNTKKPQDENSGRIVDFVVIPQSFDYNVKDLDTKTNSMANCGGSSTSNAPASLHIFPSKNKHVIWTYSIEWISMPKREWRTRWDVYFELGSGNDDVHWFSIVNALLIVLFLSGMVGMILMRSLHRDISRYNRVPTEEERSEEREESGWKLVHADVFRPPTRYPMLFCVMTGTGHQLSGQALVTLLFAAIGFLSPSNRGNLMVALVVVFILMGGVAGYGSAVTYKMFKGKRWQLTTTLTAFLFPGIVFTLFFLLNLCVWAAGSDAAVPFGTMLLVVFLWFGISAPLVFAGAWLGYRRPAVSFPVATSNIPRPIPPQPWYMTTGMCAVIGGILPFGAIFVELFFILTSLWKDKYYYVFGFLLMVFLILLYTCAEITIVLCYFQLCGEDYTWWWRSFIVSGSCGIYVFVYSFYYYATRLDVHNGIGTLLYFVYMSLISGAIFLMTGMIGFQSCLWFTKKIYASIKVD